MKLTGYILPVFYTQYITRLFAAAAVTVCMIISGGCTQQPKNCDSSICLDLDATQDKLQELLDDKCMSYGYVISQNSVPVRTHQWGLRRIEFDGGELPFDISKKLQTASTRPTSQRSEKVAAPAVQAIVPSANSVIR